MLLITIHHFSLWGQGDIATKMIIDGKSIGAFERLIFLPLGDIGVYIFAMITGFYLGTKEITCKKANIKAAKLYAEVYFYSLIFLLLAFRYHWPMNNYPDQIDPLMPLNKAPNILKSFMPVTFNQYWFVTAFILLMILLPFINRTISAINKKQSTYLSIILLVSCGIFPLINNNVASESVGLGVLITSYVIGAHIRRFGPSQKVGPKLAGLAFCFINLLIIYAISFYDMTVLKDRYINIFTGIFAMLAASGLFWTVASMKPHYSGITNHVASHMFAVYLITENVFIVDPLWKQFHFADISDPLSLNLYGIASVVAIMIICCLIDEIREGLFVTVTQTVHLIKVGFSKIRIAHHKHA
jgi:hypothetical protein